MSTNLALDDTLINEARRMGHHKTKRAAVTAALQEYIQHRRQHEMLELTGAIEYEPTYDYKALRKKPPA